MTLLQVLRVVQCNNPKNKSKNRIPAMYALVSIFGVATVGGSGAGQVNPVYGAAATTAQASTKGNAKLRGAGVVRNCMVNA
jgi:hypothetical protein